jgi:hypothetical protein
MPRNRIAVPNRFFNQKARIAIKTTSGTWRTLNGFEFLGHYIDGDYIEQPMLVGTSIRVRISRAYQFPKNSRRRRALAAK